MLMTLNPAYGRCYDNISELLCDWNRGKDFFLERGAYCSIRDLDTLKGMGATKIEFVWLSKDKTRPMSYTLWEKPTTNSRFNFVYGSLNELI